MSPQEGSRLNGLTSRELEVLRLLARDKKDRMIATELGITERTVRAHVARIIDKLDVRSRVGAAVAFAEWNIAAVGGSANGKQPLVHNGGSGHNEDPT